MTPDRGLVIDGASTQAQRPEVFMAVPSDLATGLGPRSGVRKQTLLQIISDLERIPWSGLGALRKAVRGSAGGVRVVGPDSRSTSGLP